jgi:hypothetical protein
VSRVASAALIASLDGSGLFTEERNLAIFAHAARPPGVSLAAGRPGDVARL